MSTNDLKASSGKELTEQEFADKIGIKVDSFLPFEALKIPENVVTLIYGNKGAGKSTLALCIARDVSLSKKVLFIDSEASLSSKRLMTIGVDPTNFTLKRISYVEELYDILTGDEALEYDLIVVDGLERLGFVTEAENDASSANIGVKARILNKIFRLINVKYYENGVTSIFINHERPLIDGMGHYLPGGQGQLNASSHTLRLYTTTKSRFTKNKKVAGQYVHVKVEKSRFMSPHQELKLKLTYETAELEDVTE